MSKKKAIICTILYAVFLIGVLTASYFIRNEEYGINLYQIILGTIGMTVIGDSIYKFYEWLRDGGE